MKFQKAVDCVITCAACGLITYAVGSTVVIAIGEKKKKKKELSEKEKTEGLIENLHKTLAPYTSDDGKITNEYTLEEYETVIRSAQKLFSKDFVSIREKLNDILSDIDDVTKKINEFNAYIASLDVICNQ